MVPSGRPPMRVEELEDAVVVSVVGVQESRGLGILRITR